MLRLRRHQAWTADDAHLGSIPDEALVVYAHEKAAVLVTTNGDCAASGRRMALCAVIWLRVVEVDAEAATKRALDWLDDNRLPMGRVLRVPKHAEIRMLAPGL